jgi:hypothetical protein
LTVLLADINSNGDGELPSSDQIQGLRSLLRELVSQAELNEHQELGGIRLSDETDSTPDLYAGDTTGSKFSSSSGPPHSFSSPLGFLQAALPHIPKAKLNRAISAVGDADIDMESIVEGLLTQEYFGELEERGVDGLDSDNDSENVGDDFWETVELRGKPWNSSTSSRAGRRKMNKGKTLIIVDIRQKHHAPLRNHSSQSQDEIPAPDPWTQLSSLSEYVATLLPPHPAVFFQSFFHSPDHSTPYYALRAAISSTCAVAQPDSHGYTSVLFGLLDILLPSPEAFDAEQRSLIISDTQLSLNATEGRGDDALDLVKLLWDLYSDAAAGYLQMGVYHTPSPATDATGGGSRSLISLPTISKPKHKPPSTPPSNSRKPSPFQWQAVPQRKTSTRHSLHPSTAFIPQIVAGGHRDGDTGGLSLSEAQSCRKRIGECMRKRNELLREATKAWQGGSSKTRGGEVAYYFAERVRCLCMAVLLWLGYLSRLFQGERSSRGS